MPPISKCSVLGCPSARSDTRISFFGMVNPNKYKERAEKWVEILKLPKRCLSKPQNHIVCEKHFSITQFTHKNRTRLKKTAIPEPFQYSPEAHYSQLTSKKVTPKILASQKRNCYSVPPLILPALFKGNNVQTTLPQITNIRNFPSTESKNYKPFNFCIVCQTLSNQKESEDSKSEEQNLKSFLCRILNLKSTSFCGFPICKTCKERVKELETVYMELKMLSFAFEKQKEGLKRDIVNTYLKRHNKIFKLDLTESILKKWSSSVTWEKTKHFFQQQQPSVPNNNQTIVLPVGFSFDNNQNRAVQVQSSYQTSETTNNNFTNNGPNIDTPERNTLPVLRVLRPLRKKSPTVSDLDVSNVIKKYKNEYDEEKRNSEGSLGKCEITEECNITEAYAITEQCTIKEEWNNTEEFTYRSVDSSFSGESSFKNKLNRKGSQNKLLKKYSEKSKFKKSNYHKKLTCPICLNTTYMGTLKIHLSTHHTGEKPYQCKECGKYFRQTSHLNTHTRNVHEKAADFFDDGTKVKLKARTYTCGLCDSNKNYVEGLLHRHFKSVHSNKDISDGESILYFHCDSSRCHRSFANHSQLKHHLLKVHLSNDVSLLNQCKFCDRVFCVKENFLVHSTCHTSMQPAFPCNCCYMVFNSEMELTNHVPSHQIVFQLDNFRYMCEQCGKVYKKKVSLTLHNKYCTSNESLKKSTSKRNSVKKSKDRLKIVSFRKRIPVCRGGQELKCTICGHVCKKRSTLKVHLLKVHSITGALKTNYFCEECQRFFIHDTELKGHMFRYHPEQSLRGKKYCIVCYELFDTDEAINTHFQNQHPDNICPMENCRRKCPCKFSLKQHKRIHNGEKPFLCSFCETRFSTTSALQFHINTRHTFHRSILCAMCPENPGFYDRRTFYKHVSSNHAEKNPGDILKTNYCKRKFCIDNPRIPPENKVKPQYVQNILSSVKSDVK